ncbi:MULTISPECIES: AbrB/MazE/SpoVT family DNA-binding domain-containing protein [Haloarcula]|uniref:AbrB/MazE/SpoVT family DNA-binding domain-containing protein n=1 Tax=Haloarcula TaxID=2237 RepID=UPI00240742DA|nr:MULTISPECIES: AbrB/MazE/SpoVT family DNA-binding domain-containing protein [Haloarculaceae]
MYFRIWINHVPENHYPSANLGVNYFIDYPEPVYLPHEVEDETTVNESYSVTVPAVVRREAGVEAGDKIRWHVDDDGNLSGLDPEAIDAWKGILAGNTLLNKKLFICTDKGPLWTDVDSSMAQPSFRQPVWSDSLAVVAQRARRHAGPGSSAQLQSIAPNCWLSSSTTRG